VTIAAAAVYCAALLAVSVVDVRERRIPNRIVLPAAAVVLALRTAAHPSPEWVLAALAAAAFLFVPAVAVPGGLGMGDVKLAFLLGSMLGRDVLAALVVGLVLAAVPSLVLVLRGRRRETIPLGPFLSAGGAAALALVL
jgi:leader peptidase (prepilin peptidase)/N-methyltransferase